MKKVRNLLKNMKKQLLNIPLGLFLICLPFISYSQEEIDRSIAPKAKDAPKVNFGKPQSFELENGLKVFLVENHQLPTVSMSLTVDMDPVLEKGHVGLSSMMGDMMSAGTTTKTKSQIDEAIDFVGASFVTYSSGFYFSSLSKHTSSVLEIASDVLLNPVFPEDELEKKKKRQLSGLKSLKTNPSAIASRVEKVLKYGKNHPYGEVEKIEDINNISTDLCREYYETYFRPNISYLIIVGDIDLEKSKSLCEQYFGSWLKKDVPQHDYDFPDVPNGVNVAFVNKPGAVQSVISVFYPIDFKPGAEDNPQVSVMANIFGGAFSSYLNANLREDKGYTYGARGYVRSNKIVGSFKAGASVRNEVTDSSIVQILHEMNRISEENVSDVDLERIKNNMIGNFALSMENQQTIARQALNIERYNLPSTYYSDYLAAVQKVDQSLVLSAAKKYINPSNCYVLVVGNKDVASKLKRFDSDGEIDFYDINGELVDMPQKTIPESLTADKVVQDYVLAVTQKETIEEAEEVYNNIKSYKKEVTASVEFSGQSMTMQVIELFKAPYCFRTEMSANGMVVQKEITNKKKGGTYNMQMGSTSFSKKELKSVHSRHKMNKDLIYKEIGHSIKLVGVEKVAGEDCYVIERVNKEGVKSTEFYSIKSKLKLQLISSEESPEGKIITRTMQYSDYNEFGGVLFPTITAMSISNQFLEMNLKSMEVNVEIDDDKFEWNE
ncbi:MAG: peptidase M16 [Crocinitomicaceae bacterium]|nr:peptidase M16 [Crocinitomicaceae bacterium]|tara:strand:- start:1585 stop:3747 length:2163 start_codon:yes stop_codon:yes gene_type:complete